MQREPDLTDIEDDDILEDEPEEDSQPEPDAEKEPTVVVLVFHGVDDGELEDVVEGMAEEGEKRGLFPIFVGLGGSLTMKDVGSGTPFHEALTGRKTID